MSALCQNLCIFTLLLYKLVETRQYTCSISLYFTFLYVFITVLFYSRVSANILLYYDSFPSTCYHVEYKGKCDRLSKRKQSLSACVGCLTLLFPDDDEQSAC